MKEQKDVILQDYGTVTGTFEANPHGWFCHEVNGIRWNYGQWGIQLASCTPEEAAMCLLTRAEAMNES